MDRCTDKVVGKILAGWRYDISGITPEMAVDYEAHFADCDQCRSRRRLHRTIDISLIALATISAGVFLLAFGVIHHIAPYHAVLFELGAIAGFLLSALVWLLVALATPAPTVMKDAALIGARHLHNRLPENLRERIPEELRSRISQE
jgi:hypothetical protein